MVDAAELEVPDVLGDLGVPREHTWVTLERHMECGVGLCGHCQLGSRFVCRDGPVFSDLHNLGDALCLRAARALLRAGCRAPG